MASIRRSVRVAHTATACDDLENENDANAVLPERQIEGAGAGGQREGARACQTIFRSTTATCSAAKQS